ncbi:MAG TPA: hypothetical protein DHN29_14445 [Cytophagales bacterium]|nr:hypothetical protein [Cytophagales bacterium]|tara:strand:- start:300 stop:617 length:318 start_codon:yes stop_codon:yes gene_type:complete
MAAETATIVSGDNLEKDVNTQKDIQRVKIAYIETANTVDAADTFTFDLATVGGTTLLGVLGCKHTTDDSVVVVENPTTAVSGTTITFTVPAGTDNDARIVKVFYS